MTPLPLRSFRLVCKDSLTALVENLLRSQGFVFEADALFPSARRLLHGPVPLGSSLAAFFGYLYIQDRSSMLPPLVLAPPSGGAVLDLCASPGGKTSLLGQLAGPSGFVLGNEPGKPRLTTLRRNLLRQNLFSCVTSSYAGERMPLPGGSWPRILLDPPCSGWGTAEKHPRVLSLWRGEKVKPLARLQRRLLVEAARLLCPGGLLVYSTCTTNPAENEDQALYAQEKLGLELLPATPPPGVALFSPSRPEAAGCLCVPPGEEGQGFFVALLRKPSNADSTCGVFPGAPARRERSAPRGVPFPCVPMDREALSDPWVDLAALPDGDLALVNGVVHLLPAMCREVLPSGFSWKGFPLGRGTEQGGIRVNPALHGLMPERAVAGERGVPCLDLEDTEPLHALLSGRSLAVDCGEREMGLYFRGLPLCRLAVKGRRAVLPPV